VNGFHHVEFQYIKHQQIYEYLRFFNPKMIEQLKQAVKRLPNVPVELLAAPRPPHCYRLLGGKDSSL
jgi:hypothetical protein